jgi:hypothetical protein
MCRGCDLSKDVDLIGRAGDFAGDMGFRVLSQHLIEYAVSDLIAELIRMSSGDGFGSKITFCHGVNSS